MRTTHEPKKNLIVVSATLRRDLRDVQSLSLLFLVFFVNRGISG